MINNKFMAAVATAGLLAGFATPALALTDWKSVNPLQCQALGPGTTTSELTINSYGIFNPGVTNEQVICPILADGDAEWDPTAGVSADMYVYFRAGAVAGKVACTVYTGSQVTLVGANFAQTSSPAALVAGARGTLYLSLAELSGSYGVAPQVTLLCTINPKAAMGTIFFRENLITDEAP